MTGHDVPRTGWLSVLLAGLPLCFALPSRFKVIPVTVLFLGGVWTACRQPASRYCFARAWPVPAVCLLSVVYAIGNVLGHKLGWAAFDLPFQVLLFLVISVLFAQPLHVRLIALGFSVTACLLGSVGLFQHVVQGIPRVYGLNGGAWGAIEFAMFLLVLALLGLFRLLDPRRHRAEQCLHAMGAGLGVYGALLTQSRGPLLCFIPVLLFCMVLHLGYRPQWRRSLWLFAIVLVGVMAGLMITRNKLIHRLDEARVEVTTYNHAIDTHGAVRERLEMWRTAWRAFRMHPVMGIGIDRFGSYVHQEVGAGRSQRSIYHYYHAHNEYLEAAATGGVPGLIVILLVLFVPFGHFVCHTRHPCQPVRSAALAGVAITLMYILCAVTDNVFYRAMPHSLYFFLVPGLAVFMARQCIAWESNLSLA